MGVDLLAGTRNSAPYDAGFRASPGQSESSVSAKPQPPGRADKTSPKGAAFRQEYPCARDA